LDLLLHKVHRGSSRTIGSAGASTSSSISPLQKALNRRTLQNEVKKENRHSNSIKKQMIAYMFSKRNE
jgi:hypothetical protein